MSALPPTRSFCRLLAELELPHPFWRYADLFQNDQYSFLLDSGMDPNKLGHFSFLGAEPTLVLTAKRQQSEIDVAPADITLSRLRDDRGSLLSTPESHHSTGDPFIALREMLAEFSPPDEPSASSPLPFFGGAVGYFGYETAYCCEALPDQGLDDIELPDLAWMLVDTVVAHCHRTGRSWLAITGRGENDDCARENAHHLQRHWQKRLADFHPRAHNKTEQSSEFQLSPVPSPKNNSDLNAHFVRASYCHIV